MKRLSIILVLFTLSLAGLARPACAWDKYAHMIVAQIALNHLTPKTKAQVVQLVSDLATDPDVVILDDEDKPYNDVTVAAWMDDMKSKTREFSPWHYIDFPAPPAGQPQTVAALKAFSPTDIPNVYDAIVNHCLPTLKDPNASTADKARMLGFLFHLEGDIHQPLHCIDRDRGGNTFNIASMPSADPSWPVDHLHPFWDGAYRYSVVNGQIVITIPDNDIPRTESDGVGNTAVLAKSWDAQYGPSLADQAKDLDPADWVVESNNIATQFAFTAVENEALTPDYVAKASEIAKKRIVLAGLRLANLLNSIYDPGN